MIYSLILQAPERFKRVAQVWFEANNMTVDSHVTIVRPKIQYYKAILVFGDFLMKVELKLNTRKHWTNGTSKRQSQGYGTSSA